MEFGAADASVPLGVDENEDNWELRHDEDGFTYKVLKRQRFLDPSEIVQPLPVADPIAEERRRKLRKKRILLRLKAQYQKEIDHWELLSNTLRSMQDKANQQLQSQNGKQVFGQTASSSLELASLGVKGNDNASGSLIDELLSQAEAQEAIINDVSNLCDVAESMCNAQQEWLAQSYIDLPVWSSPRKLMASLCDE